MRDMEEVPTTEARGVMQLCCVRVGDGVYGIDTREIREVLGDARPQRVSLAPEYIAGVLAYRGEVLTTVTLRALLGLEERPDRNRVLVLGDGELGEALGLLVDEVGGVVNLTENAMEKNPVTLGSRGAALFDGVFKMETGLMVRLNPQRLRPTELARSGLFAPERPTHQGGAA